MQEPDELCVRNNFWLGNYQVCQQPTKMLFPLRPSAALKGEGDGSEIGECFGLVAAPMGGSGQRSATGKESIADYSLKRSFFPTKCNSVLVLPFPPPSPSLQRAITEGSGLSRLSEALKIEAKEFVYRSYVALGQYNIVMDEISDDSSTPTSLQSVRLLARYLSQPADSAAVLAQLDALLTGPQTGNPSTLQLIAAIIYLHEDNAKDALRCVHLGVTMEHLALTTQIYLKINRPELASKTTRIMQQADEDATLTQLAWTHLAAGARSREAHTFLMR